MIREQNRHALIQAVRSLVKYVILAAIVAVIMFPIYWMVTTSFKVKLELITYPPTLWPEVFTWENYRFALRGRDFATFVRNSVIVVSAGTALAVVVGALAGYSLARLPMSRRFRNNAAFFILSTRMTPAMVAIVPFFTLYKNLGWLNTLHGLIVAYTCAALPFAVWMMQSFIQEIPPDLEEAAMVDGDSRIGALFRIVLPLARPGLAATAIFSAIVLWNEFLFAFILTTTDSARTLPVGIASLNAAFEFMYSSMASVATLAIIPIWICALIVQRYLVRGLTMGAVK
jgi:multiple sugar transport system permease protein